MSDEKWCGTLGWQREESVVGAGSVCTSFRAFSQLISCAVLSLIFVLGLKTSVSYKYHEVGSRFVISTGIGRFYELTETMVCVFACLLPH
jgi:hypothetical protein